MQVSCLLHATAFCPRGNVADDFVTVESDGPDRVRFRVFENEKGNTVFVNIDRKQLLDALEACSKGSSE